MLGSRCCSRYCSPSSAASVRRARCLLLARSSPPLHYSLQRGAIMTPPSAAAAEQQHTAVGEQQPAVRRRGRVAVIGAGAAGLAAARELAREGHTPVVFEASPSVGGTWVYSPDADGAGDLLGAADPKKRAHSSMYAQLRTNLPREIMGFAGLPFTPHAMRAVGAASTDARRFPGHAEVLRYLEAYADAYGLRQHVRHRARVVSAAPLYDSDSGAAADDGSGKGDDDSSTPLGPRWELTVEVEDEQQRRAVERGVFDAVIVANGHYSATNLPVVEGMHAGPGGFPGLQMHSHNYRTPDRFAGQTVLVVGASNSGEDLCREIGEVAAKVYVCARAWKRGAWGNGNGDGSNGSGDGGGSGSNLVPIGTRGNIERRGMVTRLTPEGGAEFEAGDPVPHLDAVVYATGYRYEFEFLAASGVATNAPLGTDADSCVANAAAAAGGGGEGARPPPALSTADQRVAPLWRHMYAPRFGPTLAFIGLPWKVVPFPMFELQARLAARALSGRASLPDSATMAREAAEFYANLDAAGVPRRWTHMMGDEQWAYNAWLCEAAAGEPPLPQWREAMYAHCGLNRRAHPETYRDVWAERDATAAAAEELAELPAALAAGAGAAGACAASLPLAGAAGGAAAVAAN